jgi:hypothetical protein
MILNNELDGMWEEVIMTYVRYYTNIYRRTKQKILFRIDDLEAEV